MEKAVNKNKNVVIFVVFLIGIVLGFVVGNSFGKKGTSSTPDVDAELLEKVEKAKKFFPTMPEMRSVYGTVKEISGNTITMEMPESPNPFDEYPLKREIVVTQSTKIVKQEQRDPAEFQKEMEAYQKKMLQQINQSSALPAPPMPFAEKTLSLDDIKANDYIIAESDKNIKTEKKFEATRITVQQNILPGAAPAQIAPMSQPPVTSPVPPSAAPPPPAGEGQSLPSPSGPAPVPIVP